MIMICDRQFVRKGNVKNAISAQRHEEINGEYTLSFEAVLDGRIAGLINYRTIFEYDDEYFDLATETRSLREDGMYTIVVEAEQLSYRLNRPEYNIMAFELIDTPYNIFQAILEDTEFSIDSIEFSDEIEYVVAGETSRRNLLVNFAELLGGELVFDKFVISIVRRRGLTTVRTLIADRHINIISKTTDNRTLSEDGSPTISYTCEVVHLPKYNFSLGDDVLIIENNIQINETMRVLVLKKNPYDDSETIIQLGTVVRYLEGTLRSTQNQINTLKSSDTGTEPTEPPEEPTEPTELSLPTISKINIIGNGQFELTNAKDEIENYTAVFSEVN